MILRAPYSSQWADPRWTAAIADENADPCDDPAWVLHGFPTESSYRFWAQRICGLACLESVLDHWSIERPRRFDLLQEALNAGVYVPRNDGTVHGLIYRPFSAWVADRFGLLSQPMVDVSLRVLLDAIPASGFGLASVAQEIRHPYRARRQATNGGHLVLLLGQASGKIVFHNPSGAPPHQAFAELENDRFECFFAGRGLVIDRLQP